MTEPAYFSNLILTGRLQRTLLALATVCALTMTATRATQAQTFTVLHNFSGGGDGANPLAGISMDQAGNLYGTASMGGVGYGTVYKLSLRGSSWTLNPLYEFHGLPDGFFPEARVILAADGTLYGTTFYGGIGGSGCLQGGPVQCGTVFHLKPAPNACTTALCRWTETQLHEFNTYPSLFWPNFGDLTFDRAGNLYGVTFSGGHEAGGVYQPTPSSGGWTESDIYLFPNHGGGAQPIGGVIVDSAGNLTEQRLANRRLTIMALSTN